jgi:hypothetical protein
MCWTEGDRGGEQLVRFAGWVRDRTLRRPVGAQNAGAVPLRGLAQAQPPGSADMDSDLVLFDREPVNQTARKPHAA